jgi:hypothetical protein
MREGKNMGSLATLKKPPPERTWVRKRKLSGPAIAQIPSSMAWTQGSIEP